MESDKVGAFEKGLEGRDLLGSTHAHEVDDIVVDDAHTHSLSQDGKLVTDVTVTDDTQSLSTDFPAASRDLVPDTLVQLHAAVGQLSGQGNDLGDDKLGD